ncbi:ABC transporter ATP-binding protein [bacterium]|nr:ABC transporter ATP-binding protein [bacterium]
MLSLRHISFKYKFSNIFNDLNLEVDKNEFIGILGPNGTGKSTLLRLSSGLLKPQSGQIFLQGEDIFKLKVRERAKKVAFLPQDYSIWLPFTCYEIVAMGRYAWGNNCQNEKIIADCMEKTSVAHLAKRKIFELSGGEVQRVCIAQALAQEAELLLLDEPTSHLDINFQIELMDLLTSLHRDNGLTVMLILHDLNLASQYCSRLLVLHNGKIVRDGEPDKVIDEDFIKDVFKVKSDVRLEDGKVRVYVKSGLLV